MYTKKPKNIPYNVNRDLKGWKNWEDFLGYKMKYNPSLDFAPYNEVKKFVQKNNIKTLSQWIKVYKERKIPRKYPRSLISVYRKIGRVQRFFLIQKIQAKKY